MAAMKRRYKVKTFLNVLTYLAAGVGFLATAPLMGLPFNMAFLAMMTIAGAGDRILRLPKIDGTVKILSVIFVLRGLFRFSAQDIVLPGLETLLLLLGLKFLDRNGPRDYLQIYALSTLLVAGSSLLSLDVAFFFYLAALILLMGPAAVLLSFEREKADQTMPWKNLRTLIFQGLAIPALALPLALLLFIILPRTGYPLFGFLTHPVQAASGFSDQVRLGNVSLIQIDDSLVFRADMERQEERFLYWRGMVFDDFDGLSWRDSGAAREARQVPPLPGVRVSYTIYLEPTEYQTLFALEKPHYLGYRNLRRFDDRTFQARDRLNRKISYVATSILTDREPAVDEDMERFLSLPPGQGEIRRLGEALGKGRAQGEKPGAIINYLRSPPFSYTMESLPLSSSPLKEFLFRRQAGNCEYFASAMAVLLRTQGVPARLIGGYRGGYYHVMGRYYSVKQRHAHVWVEAFLPGQGWVRYDPTPPIRSEITGTAWNRFLFRLRMTLDILDYYWIRHVISYDLQQQYALLTSITAGAWLPRHFYPNGREALRLLWPLPVAALAILTLFLIRRWRMHRRPSAEERLLREFIAGLERRGMSRPPWMGLEEFMAGIPAGRLQDEGRKFIRMFEDIYYRDRSPEKEELQRLTLILRDVSDGK